MSSKETEVWYRQHGICYWCGQEDAVIAGLCGECYEKRRLYNKRYWAEHREQLVAKQRERYQRNKAEGLCVQCGKRPACEGRVMCMRCRAKQYARKAYRRNKAARTADQCLWCEKPHVPGYKFCEEHLAVRRASIANARKYVNYQQHPWRKENELDVIRCKEKKKLCWH